MKKIFATLAVILAASSAFAQTAFTGSYTFGVAGGNTNSFAYNGTGIPSLTVGNLVMGSGISPTSNSGNMRAVNWTTNASLDLNDYIGFTLTAASGFSLNMTDFNFGVGRSGTGTRNWAWYWSTDSFVSSQILTNYTTLATNAGGLVNTNGVLSNPDSNSGWTGNVLSLSSLTNLSSIEFRLYSWANEAATGTSGLQGPFTFSGSLLNTNPVTGGAYWSALPGGGGSGTWTSAGTTWATNTGGAGSGQPQSSATLIFADTAGTVAVSGGVTVSNGMTFQTNGYTLDQSTITLAGATAANNAIATDTDVTTTISSELAGTTGLTKAGAGSLILSAANTFSGNVAVSAGTLQIAGDSALGNAANDIVNNGTLKTTATIALDAGRDISGSGTYDIANGTTLTVNGNINTTATTLANTGTLDLQGSTRSLGNITLNAPMTLNALGAINATGLTAPGVTNGTATINPNIVFTSGDKTVNVGAGGVLDLNGTLSNGGTTGRLAKTGSGTLILGAANNMGGLRVGATGATPTDGGTVVLENSAVGTLAQAIQLNTGTISAASNLVFTNGISIAGRANGAALLAGSNMEFQGANAFFRGTGTSGELVLNVNNATTFSGGFAATSGGGTATGITIGGSGTAIVSGNSSALVDTITLTNTVKLLANSSIGSTNVVVGSGAAIGGTGTIGGTMSLASGANFIVFDLNDSLAVTGAVSLDNTFSINSLLGADGLALNWSSIADGTYLLISNASSFSNIQNFGEANKASIGGDRFAYFSDGSLNLNVVPEPSTHALLALAAIGLAGHVIRRRRH